MRGTALRRPRGLVPLDKAELGEGAFDYITCLSTVFYQLNSSNNGIR